MLKASEYSFLSIPGFDCYCSCGTIPTAGRLLTCLRNMDPRSGHGYGGGDEALSYGQYHGDPAEVAPEEENNGGAIDGERGIVGDTYRKLRGKYQQQDQGDGSGGSKPSGGLGSFIFHKLHDAVNEIGAKLDPNIAAAAGAAAQSHTHTGAQNSDGMHDNQQHRYGSFAAQRAGNDAKWYVDGCGYMWAVSTALEQATTSIWILDCKLPLVRCILHFGVVCTCSRDTA